MLRLLLRKPAAAARVLACLLLVLLCLIGAWQVPLQLVPAAGEHLDVAGAHHLLVLGCCCLRVLRGRKLHERNTSGTTIVCDDVDTAGAARGHRQRHGQTAGAQGVSRFCSNACCFKRQLSAKPCTAAG